MSLANFNANNSKSDTTKFKMSLASINRYKTDLNIRDIISKTNSKPVILLDIEGNILKNFKGVRALAKYLGCCHKTINKTIHNKT
jgi:hypothetical protein